jgi:very-short-patch-repair endonuclease
VKRKGRKRKRKQTDIEKILEEILDEEFIIYAKEYKLGTYQVDFFIPECGLSLQCDGAYWHSSCVNCPIQKKASSPRQKFQSLRDKACISYHRRFKLSILRFCECELKSNRDFVKISILTAIDEIKKGNLVYRNRNL